MSEYEEKKGLNRGWVVENWTYEGGGLMHCLNWSPTMKKLSLKASFCFNDCQDLCHLTLSGGVDPYIHSMDKIFYYYISQYTYTNLRVLLFFYM